MLSESVRHDLVQRLRKIEGQTRGIQRMIEEGRECEEILNQLASVQMATRNVRRELAKAYLIRCLQEGRCFSDAGSLDSLVDLLVQV